MLLSTLRSAVPIRDVLAPSLPVDAAMPGTYFLAMIWMEIMSWKQQSDEGRESFAKFIDRQLAYPWPLAEEEGGQPHAVIDS